MKASENGVCPVCGNPGITLGWRGDDRYGYPGQFPLISCTSCGHKFLSAEFTQAQIEDLYTKYYPRKDLKPAECRVPIGSKTLWSWLNGDKRSAFRWVKSGERVLDIGCGNCVSLIYLRNQGCEVQGVEADRNVLPIAAHFGLKVICGSFNPANYPPSSFECVTMDQVIEHCPDPLQTLADAWQVLIPGGRLILSTPNGGGWGQRFFGVRWLNWHAPYHLHSFSWKSIELAAQEAGFKVEKLSTITSSEWLLMQWEHLLSYPAPGCPSAYWTKQANKDLRITIARLIVGAIHRLKFNHAITRLMDLLGIGDNLLAILQKPLAGKCPPSP